MENRIMTPASEQYRHEQRKRQIRNWIILLSVIATVAVVLLLITVFRPGGRLISTTPLKCYANQDVTVFQDGVLYYDGASITFVNTRGDREWSYPVGDGADFSVSDTHIIAWAGSQLTIIDAKGHSSYSLAMDVDIQFARIGKKHAAIVTGDDLDSTIYVKDLQGTHIDAETTQFDGLFVLDCGFFGNSDEYMWTVTYDHYAPIVTFLLHTHQVGHMNFGREPITQHVPSKVLFVNDRLNVFTTQHLYTFDYRAVEDVSGKTLVYGWDYLDHYVPKRGNAQILLAPSGASVASQGMKELRVIAPGFDSRYNLPTSCVGAAIDDDHIYAFSSQYMYSGKVNSQQFYTHQIPLEEGRQVTDFVGLTDNGYAIVISNNEVFAVSLPN